MQHRWGWHGQVRDDVVPGLGDIFFVQQELDFVCHGVFPPFW
jgi:hypothetical protein